MARDSLFGESILWQGRPKALSSPPGYRAAAGLLGVVALVALAFAIVAATAVHARVGGLVTFSFWCGSLALAAWKGPVLWRAEIRYLVTDKHVIWRRGPIRRTMDRGAISYATIRWSPREPGVGDLVLVRAVPTGALRRTLTLTLSDIAGPDRLWAIVRGLTPSAPLGDGDRPLAQRLDEGERVLWSGAPVEVRWTVRRACTALLSVAFALEAVHLLARSVSPLRRVLHAHALPAASGALLVAGVGLTVLLLLALASGIAYVACVRPHQLSRSTRYMVTDRRVLIRRGHEELHLERGRIAYVIAAPAGRSFDVFLVLDGPQARGFAASGAFRAGGADEGLRPVLSSVEDADAVSDILRASAPKPLRDAA